ncbi:MAG: ABC transporter substrate-binding protein [Geminicoccaceae bacterium]|nr:ABC transporter substrate-binding protein [Geminicoccaceae bacterium]
MKISRRTFGAITLCLLASTTAVRAQDIVKIGDINSYTGLPAHTEPYRKGAELAVEQINDRGGAGGKLLELVSRDDKGEPGEAVKAAEELFSRDGVALISGSLFSHVGLALASYAGEKKVLYIASEPLADSLTWQDGNRYTYRLRPNTYMQAHMLAEVAAKKGLKRWATIAPNYAYGKDAVNAFKEAMNELQPDIEWVAEQWPALFKIEAGPEVQALAAAEPDAIYNVTFGSDLAKLVREGTDRGLFEDRFVTSLLTGEPEYLDPLGDEAPEGWLVTGYPWDKIDTPEHKAFLDAYMSKYDDHPRIGSVVGYNTMMGIAAMLEKTGGSTDTEAMVDAMKGLTFDSPFGEVSYRAIDHQSTMGAYVGYTTVEDDRGTMRDWHYADGADFLPSDEEVAKLRPDSD